MPVSTDQNAWTVRLEGLYEKMQRNIQPFKDCVQPRLSVAPCETTWNCHQAVISNWCDITDGQKMTTLNYDAATYLCTQYLESENDNHALKLEEPRKAYEIVR